MTGVDSSGSGVLFFFRFSRNLPAPPIHFGVFEASADFPKFLEICETPVAEGNALWWQTIIFFWRIIDQNLVSATLA